MGCGQSTLLVEEDEPKMSAVGATERLVSRAHRIQAKMDSGSGTSSTTPTTNTSTKSLPKLDESGKLMIEEIVRRTNSSIFTESMTLGTKQYPIHVKVRAEFFLGTLLPTYTGHHRISSHMIRFSNLFILQQSMLSGRKEATIPTIPTKKIKTNIEFKIRLPIPIETPCWPYTMGTDLTVTLVPNMPRHIWENALKNMYG